MGAPFQMTMRLASSYGVICSRAGLDAMLAALAKDMPAMLADMNSFFWEFETRACQILAATPHEDEAYVQEILDAYVARSGVND